MIFRRSERFKRAFRLLPAVAQKKALKVLALFAENPRHPSLHVKKIKGVEDIWEGCINRNYRLTFHYETPVSGDEIVCVFRNVDNHEACLKNP
jgi:mRNA interferase RelE/StbE